MTGTTSFPWARRHGRLPVMGAWIWAADVPVVVADPPDWLDYLTAFGTVGAAIVPLIFFLIERKGRKAAELAKNLAEARRENAETRQRNRETELKLLEIEMANAVRESAEEREARAQAERVHIWADGPAPDPRLHILNTSSMPVSMVVIKVFVTWYPIAEEEVMWEEPEKRSFIHTIGQLGPTGETPIKLKIHETDWHLLDSFKEDEVLGPMEVDAVSFRDVNGVTWIRRPGKDNILRRFEPKEEPEPPEES